MTTLRAALVTPLSGPLASFGIQGANALRVWATRAFGLAAPWTGVELELIDAYPSAAAAIHTAIGANPDVLFGPYGAGPAFAALQGTHRVVWNHGGATARLRRPAFNHVLNVIAPAASYFDHVLRAMVFHDDTIRRVSLLHSTTGFGRECVFRAKTNSRFGVSRTAISAEGVHRFRRKPNSRFG